MRRRRLLFLGAAIVALGGLSACVGDSFETGGGGGAGQGGGSQGGSSAGGPGGGPKISPTGCSDDQREAYLDMEAEPDIAACAGGFSIPGVSTEDSRTPKCNHVAGDDSDSPVGKGCSVEDLCAKGWHVCDSAKDVKDSSQSNGCPTDYSGEIFWLTRQGQNSSVECVESGTNNLVGCGMVLGQSTPESCAPLDRAMRFNHCADASVLWSCGESSQQEGQHVVKPGSDQGGVLCCRD